MGYIMNSGLLPSFDSLETETAEAALKAAKAAAKEAKALKSMCDAIKPITPPTGSISVVASALEESKGSINGTLTEKTLNFLAHHPYEALLVTALFSYGVYDYYHENRIAKVTDSIKNGLFSLWEKPAVSNGKDEEKNQEKKEPSASLSLKNP